MRKILTITGMITLFGMINLTLTSNFSWGSTTQDSTVQIPFSKANYLEIIKLLKQQIEETKKQIENAKKIHQSIIGPKIPPYTLGDTFSFFIPVSPFDYPDTKTNYQAIYVGHYRNLFRKLVLEEKRDSFQKLPYYKIREIINTRLKYSGIIEKAVSLQTFKDIENRFKQVKDFLDKINNTKDLKELFDLQTRIKTMSSMIQNEYTKLQMVRNLSDDEETLIEIQKRKLYSKIVASYNKRMPEIRYNQ
ncbi:type IV secretion system protein [Bartonella grahamii]|uniref:P-type DNA transfer protein VirB5 n=2 Tax=Bartonella grahamii TaxID=33045 RepID=B0RKD4_BARGR|nr:type IV secretion system protein [Bartonella grahamii]ACS52015.1 TrwJ2 protein [Bartonella grahamii as4aup]CAP18760.1 TrwJ2 protein [Bartonella grahamii as4aup]SSZ39612.1 P-type DNA transfer protein VirB5 [Bartonella grahamii]